MLNNTPFANNSSANPSRTITINWELVIIVVILLAATVTRFYDLGARAMSHDESLHTRFSYNLSEENNFQHSPLMHGPILFHATALSYSLFGDNDFTSRIYSSVLGILLVMSPLLFRRWIGRWGALLACFMLLISPVTMYYGRYIRHDMPSILSALLMIWGIFMYLSGPENQRRRAHWLYVIAVAMIWNLGSKETAFIYIAMIGIFLFIYFMTRLRQRYLLRSGRGKPLFYVNMIGIFIGGVMSLGMYIVLDIINFDLLNPTLETSFWQLPANEQTTFFIWTVTVFLVSAFVVLSTALWVYRNRINKLPWREVVAILTVAVLTCSTFVVFEEISHVEKTEISTEAAAPANPDSAEIVTSEPVSTISWLPLIAVWVVAAVGMIFLIWTRLGFNNHSDKKDKIGRGFWGIMEQFPEFDLIIVIGALILPWATAAIPYAMGASEADYIALANNLGSNAQSVIQYVPGITNLAQVGQLMLSVWAFLPLALVAWIAGLMWDWRKWLVTALIFHLLFAFFFTTIFTNIAGLGTGMVYSLGYWLEQQGERRGSQPQYYYLLVIMPFYEFLPVIGSVLSMFAGMTVFWQWRKTDRQAIEELKDLEAQQIILQSQIPDDAIEQSAESQATLQHTTRAISDRIAVLDVIYQQGRLTQLPFLIFMAWLAILNLIGYSLAGEKMPWLGTHLTMPLIFLTAWYLGRIVDKFDWQVFKRQGWIVMLIVSLLSIALTQAFMFLMGAARPFSGLTTQQLNATYSFILILIIIGGAFSAILYYAQKIGWQPIRHLTVMTLFAILSVITLRSALLASFVNYDYATEFLVYAHAAPGVKWVMDDIEEISLATTDGYDVVLLYDDLVSWPYSWYFRNYPNARYVGDSPSQLNVNEATIILVGAGNRHKIDPLVEDRFVQFEHIRLWWPMQDYFGLTTNRINHLLDLRDPNAAQLRQGIFDIWWNRDYSTYGAATGGDFSVTNWPVAGRMHLYIRKDVAAQIWQYGVGDGYVNNPLVSDANSQCSINWQPLEATTILESPVGLNNPTGIDIAPDGTIYVAEQGVFEITSIGGHRISVFNADGTYRNSFGQRGGAVSANDQWYFERPNSVEVLDNGDVIVVDTWNYRLQYFDSALNLQAIWGEPGEYGIAAQTDPVNGVWGPRDIEVDSLGRIFISDTGNKRIRVYQVVDGIPQHQYDIGSGGSDLGQLNEPSGLAIHPNGNLYIADTWNQRIAVFTADGTFLDNFDVSAWYEDRGNRPYLAIDPDRELLYITDPDAGRVLVYTTAGDCVGSFGELSTTGTSLGQFGSTSGIAVAPDGQVYVVDNRLGRILAFPPFPYTPPPTEDTAQDSSQSDQQALDAETTVEPEVTAELTVEGFLPEVTESTSP